MEKMDDKAKPNRLSTPSTTNEDADDGGDAGKTRFSKESSVAESSEETRPFGYSVMIKFANAIEIRTCDDGFNSGRSFYVKASTARQ